MSANLQLFILLLKIISYLSEPSQASQLVHETMKAARFYNGSVAQYCVNCVAHVHQHKGLVIAV